MKTPPLRIAPPHVQDRPRDDGRDDVAVIEDSLETLESLYEYNHWVYSLLRPHLGASVLEIGSGTGNITQFLGMSARRIVGVEPELAFHDRFASRFAHMPSVESRCCVVEDLESPDDEGDRFDTAVSCNVLEHIEDDVNAVRSMASMLRKGGRVVALVPACPLAMGKLDRSLGHHRRYTLASLRRTFEAAGLRWVEGRYSNAVGLLGWWFNSVVLRRTRVPVKQAVAFNRLVPLLSAIERIVKPPLGQSVVGVGEVTNIAAQASPEAEPLRLAA